MQNEENILYLKKYPLHKSQIPVEAQKIWTTSLPPMIMQVATKKQL